MMKQSIVILLLGLFLFPACQYETVEITDEEAGYTEKYRRRKKDFAKDGPYLRYNYKGTTLIEAEYRDNMLQGERRFYYSNGYLDMIETYRNDTLHGPYKKFYEDGSIYIEQEFVEGAMQGWSIKYYPNGKIEEKVAIKDNLENGPFYEYYENGNIKAEGTYATGPEGFPLEQGELKEYNEQGELIRTANCIDGRCSTTWKK